METITINGEVLNVEDLSTPMKNLIGIHTRWTKELADQRVDLAKTEAALRDLSQEIYDTYMAEEKELPTAVEDQHPDVVDTND